MRRNLAMMMKLVVLMGLESIMASAQMQTRGAPTSAQPAGNSGRPDAEPTNELQMKSIDQVLHDDVRLSAKLQEMLPTEMSPQRACAGFKTLEQCVTAIHLAQNLKLPFADLKAKTTGKGSVGLRKAIEQIAATANAKDELKKAKKQAADDMKGTSLFGGTIPLRSHGSPLELNTALMQLGNAEPHECRSNVRRVEA